MHNRQRQFKQPRGASRHDDPLDFVARFTPPSEAWLRSVCCLLFLLLGAMPGVATAVAARVLFKLVNTPGFARCFTEGPDKFQRAESSDCLNLE
jgi:hypothetical protein